MQRQGDFEERGTSSLGNARSAISEVLNKLKNPSVVFDDKDLLEKTETIAQGLGGLSKSKVRMYFFLVKSVLSDIAFEKSNKNKQGDESKAVERQVIARLLKARAKALYDAKRAEKKERDYMDAFSKLFVGLLDSLFRRYEKNPEELEKNLQGLSNFLECLVGYHYYYSRKD